MGNGDMEREAEYGHLTYWQPARKVEEVSREKMISTQFVNFVKIIWKNRVYNLHKKQILI